MTREQALQAAEAALNNANVWANKPAINAEAIEAYSAKSRSFVRIAQGYTEYARELAR